MPLKFRSARKLKLELRTSRKSGPAWVSAQAGCRELELFVGHFRGLRRWPVSAEMQKRGVGGQLFCSVNGGSAFQWTSIFTVRCGGNKTARVTGNDLFWTRAAAYTGPTTC